MTGSAGNDRAIRESAAYDDGRVWETSHRWHVRAHHVLESSNTLRAEELFASLMRPHARDGSVLDIGCGKGDLSAGLGQIGARSVLGIDVSRNEVEIARARYSDAPGLSFEVLSAEAPLEGSFDLIVGRSVLHHIQFRQAVSALFDHNLSSGGRMLFMEPMSNPLTLAFHRFVRSAHTADEWPLTPADVRWLQTRFGARVRPVNLFSFPAAAVSSLVFSSADNCLVRTADRVDQALERRPTFVARGRQGIVLIDKR